MKSFLLIELHQVFFKPAKGLPKHSSIAPLTYISFEYEETSHFCCCYSQQMEPGTHLVLREHALLPLPSSETTNMPLIKLQVWLNHMLQFEHLLELQELATRNSLECCLELRPGEVLTFKASFCPFDSFILHGSTAPFTQLNVHYAIISGLRISSQRNQAHVPPGQPSYFLLTADQKEYVLPVINSECLVRLPCRISLQLIKNSGVIATTHTIDLCNQTFKREGDCLIIPTSSGTSSDYFLLNLCFITDARLTVQPLVAVQPQSLLIYDAQFRLQNPPQQAVQYRLKLVHANKFYELAAEITAAKTVKFRKIFPFVLRAEDDQIYVILERNGKTAGWGAFIAEQVPILSVYSQKLRISDSAGVAVGYLKAKLQRSKSAVAPYHSAVWRDCSRKGQLDLVTNMFRLEQFGINAEERDDMSVLVKSEREEHLISAVCNFNSYDPNAQPKGNLISIGLKQDEKVFVMVRKENVTRKSVSEADLVGIGTLPIEQLHLGPNPLSFPVFKNSQPTCQVCCIVSKIAVCPIAKAQHLAEPLDLPENKSLALSISVSALQLSPLAKTFKLDGQTEFFGVIEIDGVKKLLVLEPNSENESMLSINQDSDALLFLTTEKQLIPIKFTLLVSDLGFEEEIYATTRIKVKRASLNKESSYVSHQQLFHPGGSLAAIVSFQVKLTEFGSPSRRPKVNSIPEIEEKPNPLPKRYESNSFRFQSPVPSRYASEESQKPRRILSLQNSKKEGIKLPQIRGVSPKSDDTFLQLKERMGVRKRGIGGSYQEPRLPPSVSKLQRQNPNIDKSLQMIHPKRNRMASNSQLQESLQAKLKGLRSVMRELSRDSSQFDRSTPGINSDAQSLQFGAAEKNPEWQDNQFAPPNQ